LNALIVMETEKSILLVEDEEIIRRIILKVLERCGYNIVGVETAEDAKNKLETQTFDVIISNYHLPGMSGLDLTRELRSHGCSIPVIIVTGQFTPEVREESLDAGVDAVFPKSLNLEEFHDAIAQLIGS